LHFPAECGSEIARGLKEDIKLKKTIERLGRGLMNFDAIDPLRDNFASLAFSACDISSL